MTHKEPAVLWFGSDFYGDVKVLQMTYEQQGVYQRLLWIAHQNGGIPDDVAALARILALPRRRFEARIWPMIAPCWQSTGDGWLIQPRQEAERARRAAQRGEAPAAEPGKTQDRSEQMRQLAAKRWGKRRIAFDADADAGRKAEPHADADAANDAGRNAHRNAGSHLPQTPSVQTSTSTNPNDADATPHAQPHAASHPHGDGADASRSAERTAEQPAEADTKMPEVQLQRALLFTSVRSNLPPFQRGRELMRQAERLVPTGLTPDDVADLWDLAQRKTKDDPGGLMVHWLFDADPPCWREVLDEQRMKAKARAIAARTAAADDPLAGIYGG